MHLLLGAMSFSKPSCYTILFWKKTISSVRCFPGHAEGHLQDLVGSRQARACLASCRGGVPGFTRPLCWGTQICIKLSPNFHLAQHFDRNGGNIAILSKIGQSQVNDDMPVLPCQHKGCFLSSGGLHLLENTRIWSYHFFVVFKSILELQWFWVVMQPHLETHGILSCHFTLTKNSARICHAWNLFGCNCSISLPMFSPYSDVTHIYIYLPVHVSSWRSLFGQALKIYREQEDSRMKRCRDLATRIS